MKLHPLPQRIDEPIGESGVSVIITHAGWGNNGLPRARVTIWNGKPLAADVVATDDAEARRSLAKNALKAEPEAPLTLQEIEAVLLHCAESIYQLIPEPSVSAATGEDDDEGRPSANFPGLVDLVVDSTGAPAFLVLDESAPTGVAVVSSYVPESGPDAGERLVPPPPSALPWLLPRADQVLSYLELGFDAETLFAEIVTLGKRYFLLPEVSGYPDAYYEFCAAWVFHTHYLEPAAYSPEVSFFAVPERGKSRTGRTLTYLSRRGVHTETLREANLFRDSQDRGATLFLDCTNLWTKATKLGCEDVLLNRYERGARVSRVLYPERGPFKDTVYYDIFGPTVIATNEPLGQILDTRCVPITMPLAPTTTEYPVPKEEDLLPYRERLTAWRALQLRADWQPEPMRKPAGSRLGDVLLPLAQIVAHVAPARLESFRALAKQLEAERRRDRALTLEAEAASTVAHLEATVVNGLLPLATVVSTMNEARGEKEQVTNHRVAKVLRSLGLELRKGHANKAMVVWDAAKVERLRLQYATPAESETGAATDSPTFSSGRGSADANHANHANPDGTESEGEPVNLVSLVSVPGGGEGEKSGGTSAADGPAHSEPSPPCHCIDCGVTLTATQKYRCNECVADAQAEVERIQARQREA